MYLPKGILNSIYHLKASALSSCENHYNMTAVQLVIWNEFVFLVQFLVLDRGLGHQTAHQALCFLSCLSFQQGRMYMESELRYLYRKLAWPVSQMRDINLNPTDTVFSRSRKLTQLTFRFHIKNILKSGDPSSKNIGGSKEEEFVELRPV